VLGNGILVNGSTLICRNDLSTVGRADDDLERSAIQGREYGHEPGRDHCSQNERDEQRVTEPHANPAQS
jgi:hypothetical protein